MGALAELGWAGMGWPHPVSSESSYTVASGLTRAAVDAPIVDQRRTDAVRRPQLTLSVLLDGSQLKAVQAALNADGYSWFDISLAPRWPGISRVRLTAAPSAEPAGAGVWKMSLPVELEAG